MIKILANDGISKKGISLLEEKGYYVSTNHIKQNELIENLNKEKYNVLLVRSATKVRKN